jgi:hypothetical protein
MTTEELTQVVSALQQRVDKLEKLLEGVEAPADKRTSFRDKIIAIINWNRNDMNRRNAMRCVLLLVSLSLFSCKKEYTCQCKTGAGLVTMTDARKVKKNNVERERSLCEVGTEANERESYSDSTIQCVLY